MKVSAYYAYPDYFIDVCSLLYAKKKTLNILSLRLCTCTKLFF